MTRVNITVWIQTADMVMTLSAVRFFICGDDGGESIALTDEQVEQYALQFKEIPQFMGQEPELEPRMTLTTF